MTGPSADGDNSPTAAKPESSVSAAKPESSVSAAAPGSSVSAAAPGNGAGTAAEPTDSAASAAPGNGAVAAPDGSAASVAPDDGTAAELGNGAAAAEPGNGAGPGAPESSVSAAEPGDGTAPPEPGDAATAAQLGNGAGTAEPETDVSAVEPDDSAVPPEPESSAPEASGPAAEPESSAPSAETDGTAAAEPETDVSAAEPDVSAVPPEPDSSAPEASVSAAEPDDSTGPIEPVVSAAAAEPASTAAAEPASSAPSAEPVGTTAAKPDDSAPPAEQQKSPVRARVLIGAGAAVGVVGIGVLLLALLGRPGVSVKSGAALVEVNLSGAGTGVTSVHATTDGRPLALAQRSAGLDPVASLPANRAVHVRVSAAPPSWLRWLLGSGVSTSATFRTPAAAPSGHLALAARPGVATLTFDHPVSVVTYRAVGGPTRMIRLSQPTATAKLHVSASQPGGALEVAAAAWPWEHLAAQTRVDWVVAPRGGTPVAAADPAPGSAHAALNGVITLNFNEPVAKALGTSRPRLSPGVAGTWTERGPDALVFTPRGFGFDPGTSVKVSFDRPVTIVGGKSGAVTGARTYHFAVAPASVLRLQQVLAQLHYLPLNFAPARGARQPTTFAGEVAALSSPLKGSFSWRWPSTPSSLKAQWQPGSPTVIVKGALMSFLSATDSSYNGYTADQETVNQLADQSWQSLLRAAAANRTDPDPYSYVHVSESLPETLHLWENGRTVLTSPANTGIPGEPTALGTYPIFVRYTFNYMSGFNPDGSYYHDPVYWINYFNGGDAVHGFPRASYGWPQSLGCVELPIPTAHIAFNHLAIGDLVTVAA